MSLKSTFLQGLSVDIIMFTIIATLETGLVKNKNLIKLKATSNCWICEGWTEFKFEFKPQEKIDEDIVPV